jgi:hypothetical protein
MMQSFARAFEGTGVHIGLVTCEGVVAPENRVLSPKGVAERVVGFWERGSEAGLEVRIKEV